jgi:DNA-binding NarL/FixJ family response regulator
MTTVVLIDSLAMAREALAEALESSKAFSVLGQTGTYSEALSLCIVQNPQVVVLELELSGCTGMEVFKKLQESLPQRRVLLHSGTLERELIRQALRLQPSGFVHKTESLSQFRRALKIVADGGRYVSTLIEELGADRIESEALSAREVEVLQLVASAKSSKEIAAHLEISVRTVDNHRASIMKKLSLRDAVSLAGYAFRNGLMECMPGKPCPLRRAKAAGHSGGCPAE